MIDLFEGVEDNVVLLNYTNFVGAIEVLDLVFRFNLNINKFYGKWEQVLTSLSTNLLGSGIFYSSVQANYSPLKDGNIKVINKAYDGNFELTSIEGISRARNTLVPTCRTVKFPNQPIEGNYWIIYASNDFTTIIVSAPIIVPVIGFDISDNFGLYVLTKDREKYWNSDEPQNVFKILKKYGFDKFFNKPVNSGKSFTINNEVEKSIIKEKKVITKKSKKSKKNKKLNK